MKKRTKLFLIGLGIGLVIGFILIKSKSRIFASEQYSIPGTIQTEINKQEGDKQTAIDTNISNENAILSQAESLKQNTVPDKQTVLNKVIAAKLATMDILVNNLDKELEMAKTAHIEPLNIDQEGQMATINNRISDIRVRIEQERGKSFTFDTKPTFDQDILDIKDHINQTELLIKSF